MCLIVFKCGVFHAKLFQVFYFVTRCCHDDAQFAEEKNAVFDGLNLRKIHETLHTLTLRLSKKTLIF